MKAGWPVRNRGTYLLEFSLVVFGLVFLVVGAVDVASIFRARTAARVAVESGLRCMFPTDTDCPSRSATPGGAGDARYDVFVTPPGTYYSVPMYRFEARANWFVVPKWLGRITSVPLNTAVIDMQVLAEGYPAVAQSLFLQQDTELPNVAGTALAPTFTAPANRRGYFAISSGASGSTTDNCDGDDYNSRCLIGTIDVTESDLNIVDGNLDAFNNGANRLCWKAENPTQACTVFDSKTDISGDRAPEDSRAGFELTQALLHVSGTITDAETGATGAVTMEIDYGNDSVLGNNKEVHPLGGRLLEKNGNDDFVTRGLGSDRIVKKSVKSYRKYSEHEAYDALVVPVRKPFKVKFYLQSFNGLKIGWRLDKLQIITPTFTVKDEEIECSSVALANTEIAAKEACARDSRAAGLSNAKISTSVAILSPFTTLNCTSIQQADALIAKFREMYPGTVFVESRKENLLCSSVVENGDCPAPGKSVEYLDCNIGSYRKAAIAACPSYGRPGNVEHKPDPKVTGLDSEDCRYHGDTDTIECPSGSFSRGTIPSDKPICDNAIPTPFIAAPSEDFLESVCGPSKGDNQSVYQSAVRTEIPANIDAKIITVDRGAKIFLSKPTEQCLKITEHADGKEGVCGRNLTMAEASQCCAEYKGACRIELVKSATRSSPQAESTIRAEKAAYAAQLALEAVWPGVSSACTGSGVPCSAVKFEVKDRVEAVGESEVKVPLQLFKLLPGSNEISLTFKGSRVTEEALATGER